MDLQELLSPITVKDEPMDVANCNEISQEAEGSTVVGTKILLFKVLLSDLNEPQLSTPFYLRELPWQIKVEKCSTTISKSLGFYLRCNGIPQLANWNCFAIADLCLLKSRSKSNIYSEFVDGTFSRKIRHVYSSDANEAGSSNFISWEDLCDPRKGFLMDGSIEVQVHVKADAPHIEYVMGPNVQENGPEITYFFDLPIVSALFCGHHTSRTFNIHNMPFELKLETITNEKYSALALFLVCLGNGLQPFWSRYVEAECILMNQNSTDEVYTRTLKHLFLRDESRSGFRKFISWKTFLNRKNGFVKDDKACLEIRVRANTSIVSEIQIDRSKQSRAQKRKTMLYTVYNVSQLKETLLGPTFYVRNLPWRVKLIKRTCIGTIRQVRRFLGVFLQCDHQSAEAWSCSFTVKFKLLKNDVEECSRSLQCQFSQKKKSAGFSFFIPWEKVLDPEEGLISNDSITLWVNLKAKRPLGVE